MKEYKYIGEDEEKNGYIAKEVKAGLNKYYDISFLGVGLTQVDDTFIENEPKLWELIK